MDRIGLLEDLYPTAGNPWIGILTFFVAAVFLCKVGFENDRCCLGCYELSIMLTVVVSFGWSFYERVGERLYVELVRARAVPSSRERRKIYIPRERRVCSFFIVFGAETVASFVVVACFAAR